MAKKNVPAEPTAHPQQQPVVLTDPRSIRAIAHPARLKVVDHLFQGNVATSTELAELTGLSASAMSYHLRALEKWGIVERVTTAEDGRERPWRQAGTSLEWSNMTASEIAPVSIIMKEFFDQMGEDLAAWQRFEPYAPPPWKDVSTFSRGFPWLTPEEAKEFAEGVATLLRSYKSRTASNAPASAKRQAYMFVLVPTVDGFASDDGSVSGNPDS